MYHEKQYVSIGQAAIILGMSVVTLRRWEKSGKLISTYRTFGNHRRYEVAEIYKLLNKNNKKPRINICYARVSSHDQNKTSNDKHNHYNIIAPKII